MTRIKILFFDSKWNQLLRFGSSVSALMKQNNSTAETIGLLCENITEEEKNLRHYFDALYVITDNLKAADYVTELKPDIMLSYNI